MRQRYALPGEKQGCKATRRVRLRIAANHPELPTGGLLDREIERDLRKAKWAAKWAAMTDAEKAARLSKLKPFVARDLPRSDGL